MLLIYRMMHNIIMDQRFGPSTIDKILSDAYERQMEIILLGTQEGEALQRKLVSSGKAKIDEQFEHLTRREISLKRISRSESINHHRMIKIKRKYQLCQKIFQEVEHRLSEIATSSQLVNQYALFLVQSITDGLVRMFEEKIFIRCQPKDKPILQNLIPLCKQSYREYMAAQIGIDYSLDLEIAENMHLQQRGLKPYKALEKADQDRMCVGGVILADSTGNITFKATFDSRLSILKDICLPDVRQAIWGHQTHSANLK